MYHRGEYEGQVMISQRKAGAIIYDNFLTFQIQIKKVLDHSKSFLIGDNSSIWINLHEVCNISCMIRFHMLYDEIIRSSVSENLLDIIKPFVGKIGIYCIHDSSFFVQDHIGVVGHTVWNFVLAFEKVNLVIVYAYIFDSICDFHEQYLFSFYGGFM
mgnify:CR=1 FL=1